MVSIDGPGDSPDYLHYRSQDPGADALIKDKYDADISGWIEHYKARVAANAAALAVEENRRDVADALTSRRVDTDRANEAALLKSVHDAYIATTQSSLDRALTRANVVTAAAGSIATIYTALLGLVYSADLTKGKALSLVAIVPALFLGAALFFITIYAALIRRSTAVGPFLPTGVGGQVSEIRLITFMRWSFAGVLARSWALHSGIASLGVGVALLPLPFVSLKGFVQVIIFIVGAVLVGAAGGIAYCRSKQN